MLVVEEETAVHVGREECEFSKTDLTVDLCAAARWQSVRCSTVEAITMVARQ